jgi:methylglyoxal synthase
MGEKKKIALVAHDSQKEAMTAWAKRHEYHLSQHRLWATGTTGARIAEKTKLELTCLLSGPKGGDQQLGAMIAEKKLDILVFFTDPLSALPHDVDVKALMRISTLYQIALACNEMTADYIITSTLINRGPSYGKVLEVK